MESDADDVWCHLLATYSCGLNTTTGIKPIMPDFRTDFTSVGDSAGPFTADAAAFYFLHPTNCSNCRRETAT